MGLDYEIPPGGGGGGGASTALSNLAAVAINTSLISDTDATDDLGSASIAWRRLYLQAGSATDVPVNIELATTPTGNAIQVSSVGTSAGDLFKISAAGNVTLGAGDRSITAGTGTYPYIRLDSSANLAGFYNGSTNYIQVYNSAIRLRMGSNELTWNGSNILDIPGKVTQTVQSATDVGYSMTLATTPTGNALNITSNGGSAGDLFHIKSSGAISLPAGSTGSGNWAINFPQSGIYQYSTLGLVLSGAGGLDFAVFSGKVAIPGDDQYTWGATGDPTGASDVGIARNAAGVIKITNGSTGYGQLLTGAQAADDIPLTIQAAAAQSANLVNITSSGGSAGDKFSIEANGYITIRGDVLGTPAENYNLEIGIDSTRGNGVLVRPATAVHGANVKVFGYENVSYGNWSLRAPTSGKLYFECGNGFDFANGTTTVATFDYDSTAGNTRFLIYDVDNATLERVSVGAADSGGSGYKVLRIPN